jgi:hypothetical protein
LGATFAVPLPEGVGKLVGDWVLFGLLGARLAAGLLRRLLGGSSGGAVLLLRLLVAVGGLVVGRVSGSSCYVGCGL